MGSIYTMSALQALVCSPELTGHRGWAQCGPDSYKLALDPTSQLNALKLYTEKSIEKFNIIKFCNFFTLQECSPYAAHLYDAEDANTPMRILPGLCGDYCAEYWHRCRYTMSLLLENLGVLHEYTNITMAIEEDRKRFCDFLELKDKQYCYPNVLTSAGMFLWVAGAHNNVHIKQQ